jgi:PAS domain-containing protein
MARAGPAQFYVFLVCSALLIVALIPAAAFVYRRGVRREDGSRTHWNHAVFLVACIGYLASESLEILVSSESGTIFFAAVCYLFIAASPTWWFLFALDYSDRTALARKVKPFFWLFPVVAFAVVATNRYHHLNWVEWEFVVSGPFMVFHATRYGPWFWALWSYLQLLVFSGTFLVFQSIFRDSRGFNRQNVLVACGAMIPITINVLYVSRAIPGLLKDFSAVAYSVAALVMTFGIFSERLFDLIPIARHVLVEALPDPLIALDDAGRVVDANPAARLICRMGNRPFGTEASSYSFLSLALGLLDESKGKPVEASPEADRWLEVRAEDVRAGGRRLRLLAMRDVSERRRLIDDLTTALADIRSLEGIIPICASCKKIRDDKGYWQQVENYVSSHTRAQFTHGLCPECRKRLYPHLGVIAENETGESNGNPQKPVEG